MPKRKRSNDKNDGRPPPVPPPPKSLVKLLKSDKKVLEYFTLLQANLEVDKQKYKTRAADYQTECDGLKKECSGLKKKLAAAAKHTNNGSNGGSETSIKAKQQSPPKMKQVARKPTPDNDSSSSEEVGFRRPVQETKQAAAKKPTPEFDLSSTSSEEESFMPQKEERKKQSKQLEINDDMLGDMFDDDSSEGESLEQTNDTTTKDTPTASATAPRSSMPTAFPFVNVYLDRLQEARDTLNELGVSLVEESGGAEETSLRRRSDVNVLTDLLQALRMSTRVQIFGCKDLPPFDTSNHLIPACNVPTHPAYTAKKLAMRALELLDLYCGSGAGAGAGAGGIMNEDEWNSLTTSRTAGVDETTVSPDDEIRIGLRNRQSFVKNWMQSLHGEVAESWAVAFRSARLVSTAVHYDPETELAPSEKGGAKNQAALSTVLEQCLLVQLLVHYYDYRQQGQERLSLLCRYVLSTTPSLYVEDYPKYPPALSMCIVEGLLTPSEIEQDEPLKITMSQQNESTWKAVGVAIHVAAFIWKERLESHDDRIRDVAKVQVASYERLIKLNYDWLLQDDDVPTTLKDVDCMMCSSSSATGNESIMAMALMAIMNEKKSLKLKEAASKMESSQSWSRIAVAYCVAVAQTQIRQLDKYRQQVGTPTLLDSVKDQESHLEGLVAKIDSEALLGCVPMLAKCCIQLSSGNNAFELACSALHSASLTKPGLSNMETLHAITLLSRTPLVRVINLERRRDRSNAFQSQAKVAQLLTVNAVASFEAGPHQSCYYWGKHAFDGSANTFSQTDSQRQYVATHWRPCDLQAFDKDARKDDVLVKSSVSERACAMSHVASWIGVSRALEISQASMPSGLEAVRHPNHAMRLFRISGYASGKPLLIENEGMAPVPVCVILEDDAILADCFVDRLKELLQELPRDFHFCSLGYGRPKNAPLLPYSTHVGIPTCIWYLTGYVLSLAGAEFLQSKLPVVGPVDSWIGLRMCANWDNSFGRTIRVGMVPNSNTTGGLMTPSTKDLRQIMKFRAFCAMTPLCSQRVGPSSRSTGGGQRNWRQRDTDIEYSGH